MIVRRKKEMIRAGVVLASLAIAASPLGAGIYYEARTDTQTEGRKSADTYTVSAWVDGGNAKIQFEQSENPMLEQGSYLLTTDGGETVYLVNGEEETYMVFDISSVLSTIGDLDEMSGGMVGLDFTDGRSEVLSSTAGEPLLGRATTRLEWAASYTMKMKIMGMSRENHIETVTEAWLSEELDDLGFGVWLRKGPPETGDADLDAALAAGWQNFDGFPLKSIVRTTNTGKKGKSRTSTMVTEVTTLREESVAASTFVIPEHFTPIEMMPTAQGEEESDNPLRGLFGRKGKKKDKD
jgi:hypothetical protein